MAKDLEWPQLTTDLAIRFEGLPDCYREGFESTNYIPFWSKEKAELNRALNAAANYYGKPLSIKGIYYQKDTKKLHKSKKNPRETHNPSSILLETDKWETYEYCDIHYNGWREYDQKDRQDKIKYSKHRNYLHHVNRYTVGYKELIPYKQAENGNASENYIDQQGREFLAKRMKKTMQLGKSKLIQYKLIKHTDGKVDKTYIFTDNKVIEFNDNDKEMIEWWMITDTIMVLRYGKWSLIKVLTIGIAKDTFVVIDTEKWDLLWSFDGKPSDEYMEFEGKLLPRFEKHTKIQEIETRNNLEWVDAFFLTEKTERNEIIGLANDTIDELKIQKNIVLPWFTTTDPSYYIIEKTLELLDRCNQILKDYDILENEITKRTKLESKEHESIKQLKHIQEEVINLVKSNQSHHLAFIKSIKENETDNEGYKILEKQIGKVAM